MIRRDEGRLSFVLPLVGALRDLRRELVAAGLAPVLAASLRRLSPLPEGGHVAIATAVALVDLISQVAVGPPSPPSQLWRPWTRPWTRRLGRGTAYSPHMRRCITYGKPVI